MKKLFLIYFIIGATAIGQIQFDEKLPAGPGPSYVNFMAPVQTGELAFADIDGDSDIDVLLVGSDPNGFFSKGGSSLY